MPIDGLGSSPSCFCATTFFLSSLLLLLLDFPTLLLPKEDNGEKPSARPFNLTNSVGDGVGFGRAAILPRLASRPKPVD